MPDFKNRMTGNQKINNTATIDGQTVKVREGITILEAARKADIYIPTLCHLENLDSYGGCRLCVVTVKHMKGFPTACTTPLEPGMEVMTRTPELQKLRKEILEFTLSEHPFTCLVCKDKMECADFMHSTRKVSTITGCNFCTSNGDCELQDLVETLELTDIKFPISYRGIPPVKDNPFYDLDYNLCILCGRCVRICSEERNSHVLAFVERGNTTIVGTAFNESQKDAGCEFCGACVDVCPTGSISEKMGKWRGIPDRSVETSCVICPVACKMNINTSGGKIVNVGPAPGKRTNPPQLCLRGKFLPVELNHHPSRITTPLIKRDNKWVEISWKEAIAYTAGNLEKYRGTQFGIIASAQDTIEDNYTLQKFARKVMRSNNVDLHSSYAHKELLKHIHQFYSLHPPAGFLEIEKADTLLIIGSDASTSHPLLENRIRKAYNGGRRVIYAGAFPTRTSTFTTNRVLYTPGEETSFLFVLLSALVKKYGSGIPGTVSSQFKKPALQKAQEFAGISGSELEKALSILVKSRNLMIIAGDDLLRHSSPLDIFHCLVNIHFVKSRNHSCNILFPGYEGSLYGGVLSGVHPDYLPGFYSITDDRNIRKWNKNWQTRLSTTRGLSCNEMVNQIQEDGITSLLVMGDIPPHPDLANLKFLVQCNMFRTDLSEFADILLPVTDFLENEGHVLSLDGKLKKVNRAISGQGKSKSIPRVITSLAAVMQESGFSSKPADIFREIRSFIEIPYSNGKNVKSGFQPIRLKPQKKNAAYPIQVMLRHNHFKYRGNRLTDLVPGLHSITDEGVIGLSPSLMRQLKVKEGDQVRICTETGESLSISRPMPELADHSACLFSNGTDSIKLCGGIFPGTSMISARIEKA
ncbi:MAG: molybdopterin-dependent oxidoreductase [Bacteroidales bacterium]|nr:molybdopterin-dependent oxidoreductase [Bacteroidales bacterium]